MNRTHHQAWLFCPHCGTGLHTDPERPARPGACPSCGFVAWRNPLPGAVVILHDETDRVLLGRRATSSQRAGRWCLPGGYIELGEDYHAAAIREVWEETGLDIRPSGVYSVVSNRFEDGSESLVIVLLAFASSRSSPIAGDDLDDLAWFGPLSELPPLAFAADGMVLKRFWSGDLSIVSKSTAFFAEGGGI